MEKWERQAGESYSAYEAFQKYLEKRNLREVEAALGKNESLIKRWSAQNHWRERVDAWDNEVSRRTLEKASADFAAMIERQIAIGRMFQAKAANAIQQMDLNDLPPKYLTPLSNLAKVGVEIERSARALKVEEPQENTFVKTLTEIWENRDE